MINIAGGNMQDHHTHNRHEHGHDHHAHAQMKSLHDAHANHEMHKGHDAHAGHSTADFRTRFWVSLALTVPILYFSNTVRSFIGLEMIHGESWVNYLLFGLSTIIYLYGGIPFLRGMKRELSEREPGMMTLVAIAISAAYLYSVAVTFGLEGMDFYWELATLVDIMLVGHWIEMKTLTKATDALEVLVKLLPSTAHKLTDGGAETEVAISSLVRNDRVIVKPGEKFPADGVITGGSGYVDESIVSGESKPVSKKAGDRVIGGSLNGDGAITVTIDKTGDETFLSQVIELVRQAQASRSRTQDLANRVAFWLTIIAISASVVTFILWLTLSDVSLSYALERAVTVMVISCPHALGLAVPLVVSVSTTLAARNGLLIRNRAAFEEVRNVNTIILDKTGTLTEGNFGVTDTIIFTDKYERSKLLEYAASLEANSEHPIAHSIAKLHSSPLPVTDFSAIPGKGAKGTIDGKQILVVSPGYLAAEHIEVPADAATLIQQGKTVVFLIVDDMLSAAFALADSIRPESYQAIDTLRSFGIKTVMLTGDNRSVAQGVASQLKIDDVRAEVLPGDKSREVKREQEQGRVVAMVGDGVNDAPALAQANIGIAIGAGTDVAVESADIVLIRSNPHDIAALISLARATYRKMVQNLVWAAGYNAIAIPLAAGVLVGQGIILSPAVGAVLMSVSTIVVAINAKLLKIR
jgi:P-type Cu2+ transporter